MRSTRCSRAPKELKVLGEIAVAPGATQLPAIWSFQGTAFDVRYANSAMASILLSIAMLCSPVFGKLAGGDATSAARGITHTAV